LNSKTNFITIEMSFFFFFYTNRLNKNANFKMLRRLINFGHATH